MENDKMFRNPLHIGALRNQQCICSSGKKIKNCCGVKYAITMDEAKAIDEMVANRIKLDSQVNINKEESK